MCIINSSQDNFFITGCAICDVLSGFRREPDFVVRRCVFISLYEAMCTLFSQHNFVSVYSKDHMAVINWQTIRTSDLTLPLEMRGIEIYLLSLFALCLQIIIVKRRRDCQMRFWGSEIESHSQSYWRYFSTIIYVYITPHESIYLITIIY